MEVQGNPGKKERPLDAQGRVKEGQESSGRPKEAKGGPKKPTEPMESLNAGPRTLEANLSTSFAFLRPEVHGSLGEKCPRIACLMGSPTA